MDRTPLRAYARVGALATLKQIERQLRQLHRAFPDLFLSKSVPQLVRPELRNGSAPEWPAFEVREEPVRSGRVSPDTRARLRDAWTPTRRKAQAKRMRKVIGRGLAGRGHKGKDARAR